MRVPHDLFQVTTADENGGLGGSVGADRGTAVPRAAIRLNRATAAPERQRSRIAAATLRLSIL